jgi:hypothetical protein
MPSDIFYRYFVKRSISVDFLAKNHPAQLPLSPQVEKIGFFRKKGHFSVLQG